MRDREGLMSQSSTRELEIWREPSPIPAVLRKPLEKLLALDELQERYRATTGHEDPVAFLDRALELLRVGCVVDEADLARVPSQGPLVVVANHPFGGIEGLVLARVLLRVRPDVRILANRLLAAVPDLAPLLLPVDPFETAGSAAASLAGLRGALRHLRQGGLVTVFPAGEVSHWSLEHGRVVDPSWSTTAVRLAAAGSAAVTPAFFAGHNGPAFQLAGLLHPRLRTALLVRELLNKGGSTLVLRFGDTVSAGRLKNLGESEHATAYLRTRTYNLSGRPPAATHVAGKKSGAATRSQALVAAAVPAGLVASEIEALPAERVLVESGELAVVVVTAELAPATVAELGRLREITFREVGEGTGRATDVDRFDETYQHLVLWQRGKREIAGAYRLGVVADLLACHGLSGLYTSTLFAFRPALRRLLAPALEVGRSFLRREYQRSFSGLLLLWRGIAEFVVRHPSCRMLFGPVSISNDYQPRSRDLIVSYLLRERAAHPWSRHVRPRRPYRPSQRGARHVLQEGWSPADIEDVSTLIADVEGGSKGVPVLLKQYLKLGGRVLACNVDRAFSDALDALIVVDLLETDRRILDRFMGAEGAARFLAYHRDSPVSGSN
jgi:putative hemolysin